MINIKELKPCPFCGGTAYIKVMLGNFYIDCFHTKKCLVKPNTWLSSDNKIEKQIKR